MKHLFANWKMYLDYTQSIALAGNLVKESFDREKVSVAVFPNTLAFAEVRDALNGSPVALGAQNVNWTPLGAYTGATSAHLFKQAGAAYALVGHSERRYIFGETNEAVRKKVEACFDAGLVPVLCIGETAEDLEQDKREYRLKKQMMKVFDGLQMRAEDKIFIAYEPVWAISRGGEGKPCTPADCDDVLGWIRSELKQYTDKNAPILYGGTVTMANVVSYITLETCDGVLVGSASTKLESFMSLIHEAEKLSG
ncbi:MAG: triose-phosphate isomerase [Candidatus Magasanikbacteria bacterium RIFCSPHIGHO2_02_FULL_51_14]|uniref:Triosephosphate isomerase n=1 Tax=Candidatus Magasanikbacteria bacterium RIFCSPHIGHO2_02_FULL_51_14 TaxID=1798683 RepID=A0A1F6ME00_9BACT|nr:MAG: triose-phosphate isomerase [Candidatus Magasanikbacteria bacterium RIFCSPHIGHO2_02_FULL_51_14]